MLEWGKMWASILGLGVYSCLLGLLAIHPLMRCLTVLVLNSPHWAVLRNLAALMGNSGSVLAFDRSPERLDRLRDNAKKTGARIISSKCQDFLDTKPDSPELSGVQAILLDPSCSGSGTVSFDLQSCGMNALSSKETIGIGRFIDWSAW